MLRRNHWSCRYRIGPAEVENALAEHPAVAESAVVSSPDPFRGEVRRKTWGHRGWVWDWEDMSMHGPGPYLPSLGWREGSVHVHLHYVDIRGHCGLICD